MDGVQVQENPDVVDNFDNINPSLSIASTVKLY